MKTGVKATYNYVDGPERQLCPQATQHSKYPTGTPNRKLLGWLTQKVYEGGWEATSEQQLVKFFDLAHRVQDQRI